MACGVYLFFGPIGCIDEPEAEEILEVYCYSEIRFGDFPGRCPNGIGKSFHGRNRNGTHVRGDLCCKIAGGCIVKEIKNDLDSNR